MKPRYAPGAICDPDFSPQSPRIPGTAACADSWPGPAAATATMHTATQCTSDRTDMRTSTAGLIAVSPRKRRRRHWTNVDPALSPGPSPPLTMTADGLVGARKMYFFVLG